MGQSNLMWDRLVLCGTEKDLLRQSSIMRERAVSFETEQFHVGHISLMWDREESCETDRAVPYGTGQSHVGQSSLM